jgi:hypothetical protein
METEVVLSVKKIEAIESTSVRTKNTKIISEDSKSLFDFYKRQLLADGYTMVGEVKVETTKSFWDFLVGQKTTYTAKFEKA